MKPRAVLLWLMLCTAGRLAMAASPEPAPKARPDPIAGLQLAADLCAGRPQEKVELTGVVGIKRKGQAASTTPFAFRVLPGETVWTTIYQTTQAATNRPHQQLVIEHTPGVTNRYFLVAAVGGEGELRFQTNAVANPTNIFAGSDFVLGDLGLEFLHWRHQSVLKKEMKRSRFCQVLESRPGPEDYSLGYGRVVAWVDNETGGIIQAEAYDANGKILKEFELNSFKKIEGRWQLEEMEIRNRQTQSRTRLTFDLK